MMITGNFLESYVDMVDDSDFIMEIQSKVRNKILKKYPKRKAMKKKNYEEEKGIIMKFLLSWETNGKKYTIFQIR